jgi:hypothetical protein
MDTLEIGPLRVRFHRTIRVSINDKSSNLPPSLGGFELYKVADYKDACPASWEPEGYFLAMHDKEAMWLSFHSSEPVAMLVGAGGINALTGEKLGLKLEKDNYVVTPPQPWLDGWKGENGEVYQFVTTEYKKGEGLTVGEQIMGSESKTGGMGLAVYTAKDREGLKAKAMPREVHYKGACGQSMGSHSGNQFELCSFSAPQADSPMELESCSGAEMDYDATEYAPRHLNKSAPRGALRAVACAEVGVGKGGKITQKVYADPHGLEVWDEKPVAAMALYFIDGPSFTRITGKPMPPLPRAAEEYYGKWYGLQDELHEDVAGSEKFCGLKTVFAEAVTEVKEAASE